MSHLPTSFLSNAAAANAPEGGFAPADLPKFYRIQQEHANGLVAFEFAVGWPDLTVELVLPKADFLAFCENHQVQPWPLDAIEPVAFQERME